MNIQKINTYGRFFEKAPNHLPDVNQFLSLSHQLHIAKTG